MSGVYYGWWIVLATSFIHFWGAGTFFYSFTAFFNPLIDEFGWSYAAISLAASIRAVEGGIASPLVGFATDRFGARRLLVLGSLLSGLGFFFLSRIESLSSFYIWFIFLSLCCSLLFPIPGWAVVANWFTRKRAAALGVLSASIGLGGGLIFLVNWLITVYGWRWAMMVIALGMWLICLPASLAVRQPSGDGPPGEDRKMKGGPGELPEEVQELPADNFTVGQAMRTKAFWLISLVVTVSSMAVHTVTVHIMPHLLDVGLERYAASLAASLLILLSVSGRFLAGNLSGRFKTRHLLAGGLFLQAVGVLILTWVQTSWGAFIFALLFGPGYGTVITVRLVIQAEYFGPRSFGGIQGATMAINVVGTMAGPVAAGLVRDLYGTYAAVWLIMGAILLASVPLAMAARRPPQKGGLGSANDLIKE
jgi:sugar phosphate permease